MEAFVTETQTFLRLVQACISHKDAIQLSGLYGKLIDYHNLFSRMNNSIVDVELNSTISPILQRITNFVEDTKAILAAECEEEKVLSRINLPVVPHDGRHGRPQKFIPVPETRILRNAGLSWNKIGDLFDISARTLRRRNSVVYLETRSRKSNITNEDLDRVIRCIIDEHPKAGYVLVWSNLKTRKIFISFERLKKRMKLIDPYGIFLRSRKKLHRRKYRVKGVGYLRHIDGNEKLVNWRFYIHGAVDGHSRLIIYLGLAHNKSATTVLNFFTKGVEKHGLPVRVRADGGTKNVLVKDYMSFHRSDILNPFIVGKSVHNIKIEKMWTEVGSGGAIP